MHARPFEQLLKQLPALTRRQRERLLEVLAPAAKLDKTVDLIEQAVSGRLACPRCQSQHFTGTAARTACSAIAARTAGAPATP